MLGSVQMTNSLMELPKELLALSLSLLPYRNLMNMLRVCKHLNSTVHDAARQICASLQPLDGEAPFDPRIVVAIAISSVVESRDCVVRGFAFTTDRIERTITLTLRVFSSGPRWTVSQETISTPAKHPAIPERCASTRFTMLTIARSEFGQPLTDEEAIQAWTSSMMAAAAGLSSASRFARGGATPHDYREQRFELLATLNVPSFSANSSTISTLQDDKCLLFVGNNNNSMMRQARPTLMVRAQNGALSLQLFTSIARAKEAADRLRTPTPLNRPDGCCANMKCVWVPLDSNTCEIIKKTESLFLSSSPKKRTAPKRKHN